MVLKIVLLVSWTLFCCFSVTLTSCPVSSYTELQGRIISPGFRTSGSYGENLTCAYNINLPPGRGIILELKTFSVLGTMPDCDEDSLEIIVGNKLMKQSSGTMFTPNWPLHYPSLIACNWQFHIPEGKVARIFFTFEVDLSAICDEDTTSLSGDDIRISGTTTAGRPEIIKKRLCELPDPAFFSVRDMRTVQVKFESNVRGDYSIVVLGYATYSEGTLDWRKAGCEESADTGASVPPKGTCTSFLSPPHLLGLLGLGILICYICQYM